MIKKLVFISILIFSANFLFAQKTFKLVQEIDLTNLNTKKLNKYTTEFRVNNKLIDKHKTIKLNEIVKLCDNCFAEVEDMQGNLTYLSFNDFNTKLNQQVALLLIGSNFSSLGDTLVISEDALNKLDNNELIDVELGSVTNVSYNLNSKNWDKAKKSRYFKDNSIVFPFDNSTDRWITNVHKIRIYKP